MRCSVYARKSTQQDVVDDQKSVTRQVDGARRFIARHPDWSLRDEHIYVDDAVSGALFINRPGFQRLMADASAGAFDIVVLFDLSRFGRDGEKTRQALYTLAEMGVVVWDYSKGKPIDLYTFEGRLPAILETEFAEHFRQGIRQTNAATTRRKAEAGLVTGCPPFGYTSTGDKGARRFQIHEAEAAIVREIFTRYARGESMRAIADSLNTRGVPAHRGRWAQSTLSAILTRPLYTGLYVCCRTKRLWGLELVAARRQAGLPVVRGREREQLLQPEDTWVRRRLEELRIVPARLARRVALRLRSRNQQFYQVTPAVTPNANTVAGASSGANTTEAEPKG